MNLCGRPAQRITQLQVARAGEHSRLSTAAEGKSSPQPADYKLDSKQPNTTHDERTQGKIDESKEPSS